MMNAYRNIFHFSKVTSREVQDRLFQLLQYQQFRISIANAVKIFPTFFTHDYIKKFIQCRTFKSYLNLLQDRNYQDWPSLKRMLKFGHSFPTLLLNKLQTDNTYATLQMFINWLRNDCLQYDERQNNIVMEWMDMRTPQNWFYNSYNYEDRVFIYNHGPTNSGKTAAAIQQLRNLPKDKEGIYMAPLRLLAWQTFQKLQHCNLITGQDKQYKNSNLTSCTIQTLNLNNTYELAVIDQIQMIGDSGRGWAWTKAILGIQAKRIHLCGDQRALNLISKLIKISGGRIQEKKYSRLSKLSLIHRNFKMEHIEPGDAIIQFSTHMLYSLKRQINKLKNNQNKQKQMQNKIQEALILGGQQYGQGQTATATAPPKKQPQSFPNYSAIVYGKMPPQCRKNQAQLFNSGELPYLVATNAIGMGLNLKINRIIFVQLTKMGNQGTVQDLQQHQIQQIAGRAGRGVNTTGYVQCANRLIFNKVQKALQNVNKSYNIQLESIDDGSQKEIPKAFPKEQRTGLRVAEPEPELKIYNDQLRRFLQHKECQIQQAAIFVQVSNIVKIMRQIQKLIGRKITLAQTINFTLQCSRQNKQLYFTESNEQFIEWIKLIQPFKFELYEQFTIAKGLNVSISTSKDIVSKEIRLEYARQLKQKRNVSLPKTIVQQYQNKFNKYVYLEEIPILQKYYSLIQNYVWMWNYFQFSFPQIDKAKDIKAVICEKIEDILRNNKLKPYEAKIHAKSPPKQLQISQDGKPTVKAFTLQASPAKQKQQKPKPSRTQRYKKLSLAEKIKLIQNSHSSKGNQPFKKKQQEMEENHNRRK